MQKRRKKAWEFNHIVNGMVDGMLSVRYMIMIMVSIHYIPKETCPLAYKNHLHNPHCHFKLLDSNSNNIYTMRYSGRPFMES